MGNMLDRWAEKGGWIEDILEMLNTFEAAGVIEWTSTAQPRKAVCEHFDIDLAQLDRERRALLEDQRRLNKEQRTCDKKP